MSYNIQTVWPPTEDSIFGDTYAGVPNPNVPHVHPWPTRYHGPIFTVPGTAKPTYRQRPYAKAPYMGMGAAPLFDHVLPGGGLLDAIVGAGIGYVVAPKENDRPAWMVIGAVAGLVAGLAGLAGTAGAGVFLRNK